MNIQETALIEIKNTLKSIDESLKTLAANSSTTLKESRKAEKNQKAKKLLTESRIQKKNGRNTKDAVNDILAEEITIK